MALDILIKNGTIIDGAGTPRYRADVAIKSGRISRIGFLGNQTAQTVVDATGLFVTPGFIDINNASDRHWTLMDHPSMESFIYQGVTTIVGGSCGSSLAPLATGNIIANIQKWADISRINVNWSTVEELFEEIKKKKLMLNFSTLIGHATLRRNIVKDEFRELTDAEIAQMGHLLKAALNDGARGFSTALNYSHVKMATKEEIAELTSVLKPNQIYSAHLRDEENFVYDSVLEAIEIAEKNKTNLEISHLKVVGKNNWHLFDKCLEAIHKAPADGLNINFDIYPYTSTASVFYTFLPDWAAVGGRAKLVENLKDPDMKAKIITEMKPREEEFKNIIIAFGNIDKTFVGKTLENIAKNQGTGILEAMINLLIAAEGKLVVFWPALSEENFIKALKSPLSIIASDGAAYNLRDAEEGYMVHPRSFGCFTRVLSYYARDKKIISFEEAIKKITALPALKMGFTNRGILKDGYFADIAIFNPEALEDLATYENPFQYSRGIDSVIINGKIAMADGKIKNQGLGQLL